MRRQGGARPPVLDRAQLVPLSGPEVVVFHRKVLEQNAFKIVTYFDYFLAFHRKVLEQNTFKGLTHFDHVFSIPWEDSR